MGLLEFLGISDKVLEENKVEESSILTEAEILGLRNWINFKIGEEGNVKGKIIASSLPEADGYSVIAWSEDNEAIIKFPSFYSAEQIERRTEFTRKEAVRDLGLVRVGDNTYSLFPEKNRGLSFRYSEDYDYGNYANRLRQSEFDFRS